MLPDTRIHPRDGTKTTGQRWLAILLFSSLALLYYGFYIIGITANNLLMQPVINAIPLSFLGGAVIIVASVAITFIYAFAANRIDEKKGA